MVVEMDPSAEVSNSAFLLLHGHCFRLIKSGIGLTIHCDEPVVWEVIWRDVKGEVWTVEACVKHTP